MKNENDIEAKKEDIDIDAIAPGIGIFVLAAGAAGIILFILGVMFCSSGTVYPQ